MVLPLRLVSWLLFSLCATGASAMVLVQPPAQLQGAAADIAIEQGVAYVATSAGVELFDVSQPKDGSVSLGLVLPGAARAIAIDGGRAAVLGSAEVHILDISNPRNPIEIGAFPTPAQARDVALVGNHVYVAENLIVLRIYDISDPANPVEVGGLSVVPASFDFDVAIAVADGTAYLNSAGGLAVIDVRDPTHPALLFRTLGGQRQQSCIAVRGNRLYLPDEVFGSPNGPRSGIRILDVSNPAAPIDIGFAEVTPVTGIGFAGDLLLALESAGLWAFDISDPAHPVRLGTIAYGQWPRGGAGPMAAVEVVDGYAHIAGIDRNLGAVDLSRPEFPRVSSFGEGYDYDRTLVASGELLYALGYIGQVDVLDVSTPLAPVVIGDAYLGCCVRDAELVGNLFYTGSRIPGVPMHIVDVSDPTQPHEVGTAPAPFGIMALEHSQDRLYVLDSGSGVSILDISDPPHPVLLGSLDPFDGFTYAFDLVLSGHLLYVTGVDGVRVVDVSDASAPRVIGRYDNPPNIGFPRKAAIAGEVLFLAYDSLSVGMVDVSDPTHPVDLGALFGRDVPGAWDIHVEGTRLYISDGTVRVLDVSNPRAPSLLGGSEGAYWFAVNHGIVYSAAGYALSVIDFGPEYAPPREVAIDVAPGDPQNRVLVTKPGAVLVGLHGSADFDVRDVVRSSLAFGPEGARPLLAVRLPLNRDRHPDLAAIFWVPDAGIALGDKQVCLSGETRDGRAFRGCDAIQPVIGCGRGYVMALIVPLCLPLARAARRTRRRR